MVEGRSKHIWLLLLLRAKVGDDIGNMVVVFRVLLIIILVLTVKGIIMLIWGRMGSSSSGRLGGSRFLGLPCYWNFRVRQSMMIG